jgi:hypothetical protein
VLDAIGSAAVCWGVWHPEAMRTQAKAVAASIPGADALLFNAESGPRSSAGVDAEAATARSPWNGRRRGMAWDTTASPRTGGGLGNVQGGGTIANPPIRSRAVHPVTPDGLSTAGRLVRVERLTDAPPSPVTRVFANPCHHAIHCAPDFSPSERCDGRPGRAARRAPG